LEISRLKRFGVECHQAIPHVAWRGCEPLAHAGDPRTKKRDANLLAL